MITTLYKVFGLTKTTEALLLQPDNTYMLILVNISGGLYMLWFLSTVVAIFGNIQMHKRIEINMLLSRLLNIIVMYIGWVLVISVALGLTRILPVGVVTTLCAVVLVAFWAIAIIISQLVYEELIK